MKLKTGFLVFDRWSLYLFSAVLSCLIPTPLSPLRGPPSFGKVPPVDAVPQSFQQATGVYLCIHGHFYQPPRENPDLNTIERQPSAEPFHDWNERILHECYRPNAFARVLNEKGEILRIVNNYEYISFNIGPTLMSWLERQDLQTYQRIVDADRRSCETPQLAMATRLLKRIITSFCPWPTSVTK